MFVRTAVPEGASKSSDHNGFRMAGRYVKQIVSRNAHVPSLFGRVRARASRNSLGSPQMEAPKELGTLPSPNFVICHSAEPKFRVIIADENKIVARVLRRGYLV